MSKKILTIILITHIIAIGVGVYGGMRYAKSKSSLTNLRNLSPEQRQQMFQQAGANGRGGPRSGNQGGANFTAGDIITKDDPAPEQARDGASKSITIKLRDGGSKIIFFSDSTEVVKSVSGTASDLEIGKTITVNGTANQDGSITAQSIQLRPANPPTP